MITATEARAIITAAEARAVITAEIERQESHGIYTGIVGMDAARILATRVEVEGVCAALGVDPGDCVIAECEDGIDRVGWTYFTEHGALAYMVKHDNGMIGAQFGCESVYAATLEEAESQMVAVLLPRAEG